MQTALDYLKEACRIPSWVNSKNPEGQNEIGYAVFIQETLERLLPGQLEFLRIPVSPDSRRYSLLVKGPGEPELLIASHLDTVPPSTDKATEYESFSDGDREENGRYYHLGSADTKAGAAALLAAIESVGRLKNTALLFYADEEYDFAGINALVSQEWSTQAGPWLKGVKRAIFLEPAGNTIKKAHRGLVEMKIRIHGQSGHAAKPGGSNALTAAAFLLQKLAEKVAADDQSRLELHPEQQKTSINVAGMSGGQQDTSEKAQRYDCNDNTALLPVVVQPNKKAAVAEIVLDIRPGDPNAHADYFLDILSKAASRYPEQPCSVESINIKHDYAALVTSPAAFQDLADIMSQVTDQSVEWIDMEGYSDGQLFGEAFKVPVVYTGPAGENTHGPYEYVEISSLNKFVKVLEKLIS